MESSHGFRINRSEHCEPIASSMFSSNNGTGSVSAQCEVAVNTHTYNLLIFPILWKNFPAIEVKTKQKLS